MSALEQMTIKELVSRHNELVKEADQLASWKGRKDLLVEKVAEVMKESRKGRTIQAAAEELLKATAYVEDGKNIGHPYEYVLRHVLESSRLQYDNQVHALVQHQAQCQSGRDHANSSAQEDCQGNARGQFDSY